MPLEPFTPNTTTKYRTEAGDTFLIPAETISQTGGVIVVTQHRRNNPELGPGYGLTHTLTGASRGSRLSGDIKRLKKKARRFWKSLTPEQKKIWRTSSVFLNVQGAASQEAVRSLKA